MSSRLVLPLSLTLLRLFLGPAIVWLAYAHPDQRTLMVAFLYAAILSDIFDGIAARRMGVAYPWFRRLDSRVDLAFWCCAGWAAHVIEPALVGSHLWAIIVLAVLEAACYAISFARFGRGPGTHGYLAKAWALALVGAFTALLGYGVAGAPFWIMFVIGVAADIEIIAIMFLLPSWQHDVPSVFEAIRIRRGLPARRCRLLN